MPLRGLRVREGMVDQKCVLGHLSWRLGGAGLDDAAREGQTRFWGPLRAVGPGAGLFLVMSDPDSRCLIALVLRAAVPL